MSAPRAKWIGMEDAIGIIRRETRELPATYEPPLLSTLASGVIRTRRIILHEADETLPAATELQPSFWEGAPSRTLAMREPNKNEHWYFEVHYGDLQEWLSPINLNKVLATSSKAGRKGGKASKYNQALQEVVNQHVPELIEKGENPTVANVLNHIERNQLSGEGLDIPDCEIEIDGDKIVFTLTDGTTKWLAKRSLERYINRAKQS